MEEIRLNKYLSDAGVCSRREADRMIEAGKVLVDGEIAVMGMKIRPDQRIIYAGKAVGGHKKPVLLAVYKPRGIVCTTAKFDKDNIVDYISYPQRIYPVGRLDKDSEGLILMTNQGDLVNKILRGSNNHEKEYMVRVNKPVTEEFINAMQNGVPILDTVTKPCRLVKVDDYKFKIVLTQGLNRQIRRMCEALDYRVRYLKRLRVMNIRLGNLKPGEYREIKGTELERLKDMLKDSTNLSYKQTADGE